MELEEGQVKFLKQYIQRQEIMLLEYIRKGLDLEIKILNLNNSLQEISEKYNESQKNVAIQNELMQQAATSVESLTLEKKSLQEKEIEYLETINELEISLENCLKQKDQASKRNEDLAREYKTQVGEINKLVEENKELSSNQQSLNKKKPKAILPTDEF